MDTLENFGNFMLLRDRVYQALKSEIIVGNFKPGERLNILDLANRMNISCAPVREALNMLSKDGLVDLAPHKRPAVAVGSYEDYLVSLDLRKMLEPYAAKISIASIPKEKIEKVAEQLQNVLTNPLDIVAYVESDMAVHEMLHAYSGSRVLSDTLTNIKTYSMRFRYLFDKDHRDDKDAMRQHIVVSTNEHMDILRALESGDGEAAYQAVLRHIENYGARNRLSE